MATTNASCKLHRRSNTCDEPMIGGKRKRRNDTAEPSSNNMINDDGSNRQARQPMRGHRRHKHTINEHCNKDISSKRQRRRRRHKEELAYKAATIQQALDDTEGRRSPHNMSMKNRHDEHALQSCLGSFDTSSVKLVSSTDCDKEDEEDKTDSSSSSHSNMNEQCGISSTSMSMYEELVHSTRQCYKSLNGNGSRKSTRTTASYSDNNKVQQSRNGNNSNDNNGERLEDSRSTLTPPPTVRRSSFDNFFNNNHYRYKNIDSDNRSEYELSSNMADDESSTHLDERSSCCDDDNDEVSNHYEEKETSKRKTEQRGYYSVVG